MNDAAAYVRGYLDESAAAMAEFAQDRAAEATIHAMAAAVIVAFRAGGKLLLAGNGGSAGDAQHIAGEFVGRLMFDRAPLPAIALTTDSTVLTATGNDYGFEQVFARQVQALGARGDVFLAISTSGNSPNLLRALESARRQGVVTFGFGGAVDGAMAPLCDHLLRAPSRFTPVIQQVHITAAHLVCALVERAMFPRHAADADARR